MADIVIAAADVSGWLKTSNPADIVQLNLCVDAALAWVNGHTDTTMAADSNRKLGAIMLAARWYSRRSSSTGVMSFDQYGPAYVARYDSDILKLCGLDRPLVG